MNDPPRILDRRDPADPRGGLKRALLAAARAEAPLPPEARRQLLDALGAGTADSAPADTMRARASEWQPRAPLFSAVLRRDPGDARRFAAGALAGAIALLALIFGGDRSTEQLVDEPRPMVELRAPVIRVLQTRGATSPRAAYGEPPAPATGHAPEPLLVPAGKGEKHSTAAPSSAPAEPPVAVRDAPVEPVPSQVAAAPAGAASEGSPPAPLPEILPFGEGMSPPRLIEGSDPVYPLAAREARVEGTMIVRCVITTTGTLQRCRVLKSLPWLEQPVLEALARRRYTPVLFQGRPVNVEYVIPLRFELR
jgi:protein TonB